MGWIYEKVEQQIRNAIAAEDGPQHVPRTIKWCPVFTFSFGEDIQVSSQCEIARRLCIRAPSEQVRQVSIRSPTIGDRTTRLVAGHRILGGNVVEYHPGSRLNV